MLAIRPVVASGKSQGNRRVFSTSWRLYMACAVVFQPLAHWCSNWAKALLLSVSSVDHSGQMEKERPRLRQSMRLPSL
ncbi:hypothetical protein D3C71_2063070 [compost metagenome]